VIIEVKGLAELNARLIAIANGSDEAMRKGAYQTMARVEREAKQLVPTKTGNLKTSIHADTLPDGAYCSAGGGNGLKDVRYAPYVEYGTVPHDIRPVNKKALFWKGAAHPVMVVHHPGTKAHPFFTPAVEYAMGFAEQDMKDAVDALIGST
jgi:hypothetical protein